MIDQEINSGQQLEGSDSIVKKPQDQIGHYKPKLTKSNSTVVSEVQVRMQEKMNQQRKDSVSSFRNKSLVNPVLCSSTVLSAAQVGELETANAYEKFEKSLEPEPKWQFWSAAVLGIGWYFQNVFWLCNDGYVPFVQGYPSAQEFELMDWRQNMVRFCAFSLTGCAFDCFLATIVNEMCLVQTQIEVMLFRFGFLFFRITITLICLFGKDMYLSGTFGIIMAMVCNFLSYKYIAMREDKIKIVKLIKNEFFLGLIGVVMILQMMLLKYAMPTLPVGTIFPVFQQGFQGLFSAFLLQGLQYNLGCVDTNYVMTLILKLSGIAINVSDVFGAGQYKEFLIVMFVFNQCYLMTGFHPLNHTVLHILNYIITRPIFDGCRKCANKISTKIKAMLTKAFLGKRFEKLMESFKLEPIYEVSDDLKNLIFLQNQKQSAYLAYLALMMFVARMILLYVYGGIPWIESGACFTVSPAQNYHIVLVTSLTVLMMIVVPIVDYVRKMEMFAYWKCDYTWFEKVVMWFALIAIIDGAGLAYWDLTL